jgi:hypothetical protein
MLMKLVKLTKEKITKALMDWAGPDDHAALETAAVFTARLLNPENHPDQVAQGLAAVAEAARGLGHGGERLAGQFAAYIVATSHSGGRAQSRGANLRKARNLKAASEKDV